ncbi:MAG TPA: hypothetical protein VIT42_10185 [Microlunatus sp.]
MASLAEVMGRVRAEGGAGGPGSDSLARPADRSVPVSTVLGWTG